MRVLFNVDEYTKSLAGIYTSSRESKSKKCLDRKISLYKDYGRRFLSQVTFATEKFLMRYLNEGKDTQIYPIFSQIKTINTNIKGDNQVDTLVYIDNFVDVGYISLYLIKSFLGEKGFCEIEEGNDVIIFNNEELGTVYKNPSLVINSDIKSIKEEIGASDYTLKRRL